ncbi:MAG: hypothetical protein P8X78_04095, partial [Nitrosopumilaceae archaeon]
HLKGANVDYIESQTYYDLVGQVRKDKDMKTASELMASRKIRKLPVIENDQVVGMIIASNIAEPN